MKYSKSTVKLKPGIKMDHGPAVKYIPGKCTHSHWHCFHTIPHPLVSFLKLWYFPHSLTLRYYSVFITKLFSGFIYLHHTPQDRHDVSFSITVSSVMVILFPCLPKFNARGSRISTHASSSPVSVYHGPTLPLSPPKYFSITINYQKCFRKGLLDYIRWLVQNLFIPGAYLVA